MAIFGFHDILTTFLKDFTAKGKKQVINFIQKKVLEGLEGNKNVRSF